MKSISWLDIKLGIRALVRYPVLTLVGSLGIAVSVAIGTFFFAILPPFLYPTLPLDEGERVFGVSVLDLETSTEERRILHDFGIWREELALMEELGAFQPVWRNLIIPDGLAEPVEVAEITASGFRVAGVDPLLGRVIFDEDEREGVTPVVVIGYSVWQTHFGGDPEVVGRNLSLGNMVHTIIGVMPEGFAFPLNFQVWTPLRLDPVAYGPRQGPRIFVFGRLAPGVVLEGAQTELTTLGQRTAAALPETHEQLEPRIVSYPALFSLVAVTNPWEVFLVLSVVGMLLFLICANVAILVYTRVATREGEIVLRSALGATRRRIAAQLFAEALVLSVPAAVVGLLIARVALGPMSLAVSEGLSGREVLPFWVDPGISPGTVLYAMGLTVLVALVIGVLPALKATGRRMRSTLSQLSGGTGMQLGKKWTVLIVAQVTFAVAILPGVGFFAIRSVGYWLVEPGFAAEQFLTTRLEMDVEAPPVSQGSEASQNDFFPRFADRLTELMRRLEVESSISGVTSAASLPHEGRGARVELQDVPLPTELGSGHSVLFFQVDEKYFDVFDVPVLAGRQFHSDEFAAGVTTVIVNQAFAEQALGGRNAVGHRLRYVRGGEEEEETEERVRWFEIVGVVGNLPPNALDPFSPQARLYHPALPGQVYPAQLALRVRGSTVGTAADRLREITTAVDPALRLHETRTLDEAFRQGERRILRVAGFGFGLVTLSVFLLSAVGIYALISLAVTQRRREIGIRSALGAGPYKLLASVLLRVFGQLIVGVVLGIGVGITLEMFWGGALMDGRQAVLLPTFSVLMIALGLLSTVGPARRVLGIQPTEALREE